MKKGLTIWEKSLQIVWLSIVGCLLFVPPTQAAELFFQSANSSVRVGDQFEVVLLLRTSDRAVNVLQGNLAISQNLKILGLEDGQSIVTVWTERPQPSRIQGAATPFSGMIPGGYEGSDGLVFLLKLEARSSGPAQVSLDQVSSFLNDGLATPETTTIQALQFNILEPAGSSTQLDFQDRLPPELFTPEIGQNADLFQGRYFLVFQTVDKQSGIDHYEISELATGDQPSDISPVWRMATSPYELRDQSLSSDIYVRAVDRVGNFIVVKFPARFPKEMTSPPRHQFLIALLLVSLVVLYGILRRKLLSPKNNA